uniref:Uncharacterized protein n=1 Tax=Lepeophtheirus salmonis TaxID=72036 RepID=A0A0K2T2J9_LEPSM
MTYLPLFYIIDLDYYFSPYCCNSAIDQKNKTNGK